MHVDDDDTSELDTGPFDKYSFEVDGIPCRRTLFPSVSRFMFELLPDHECEGLYGHTEGCAWDDDGPF